MLLAMSRRYWLSLRQVEEPRHYFHAWNIQGRNLTQQKLGRSWCSYGVHQCSVHQWFIRFHQRKPWVPTWDWVLDTWSLRIQRIPWLHPSMDPRHISLSTEQHQDTLRDLRVCKYIQNYTNIFNKNDQIWSNNQICVLLIFTLSFLAAPSQVVHVHLYTNGISSNSHSPMRH
jgi:hypothetical protein